MRRYLILLFISTYALAQGARYDNFNVTSATNVQTGAQSTLFTLPYSKVTVCAYPDDGGTPCTNTVPVYSDQALTQVIPTPVRSDVHGRFGFWLYPGTYAYSVQDATGKFLGTYAITLGSQTASGGTSSGGIDPTTFAGADIGAKINGVAASSQCVSGCTILLPTAAYTLSTPISIAAPHVRVLGNGSTFTSASATNAMVKIAGDYDEWTGTTFALNGSTYGIIATGGVQQLIQANRFTGAGGIYVQVSASPSIKVLNNDFDGSTGCAYANNINVFESSYFTIQGGTALNTCGFGVEVIASRHGLISGMTFNESPQQRSITSTSGQTAYTFTWPSNVPTIKRVWMQVAGVPTSTGVTVAYTDATHTAVTLPTAPTTGTTVTALGWTSLENIQVNSQSFDITIDGNVMHGTGDTGIDVVSDYHMVPVGSATATQNQQAFIITASTGLTASPAVVVGGRVVGPDQAKLTNVGSTYTVNFLAPQTAGTVVRLFDFQANQSGSVQADYPGQITISNNTITGAAAAGIAPEIPAKNIIITGNVIEDCGMGLDTPAYSSGIFTGSAQPIVVKNNTITNTRTVPTMRAGISVQAPGFETGAIEKPVLVSGNTYQGTFANGALYIPAFTPRQSGIDVSEGVTSTYPEQPNFDSTWSVTPANTRYLTYVSSGTGFTRDTAHVMGGVASAQITTGNVVDITPNNQGFFANSIMKVTFWAKATSGTSYVRLYSSILGFALDQSVPIVNTRWQQYSIFLSTSGVDPGTLFLRVEGGTNGTMNIQYISFAATPFVSGGTTWTGTSSTAAPDSTGSGVPSVNGITSAVTIAAGSGISVTPTGSGSTLTIAATGGSNPSSSTPIGGNWSTTGAYVPGSVVTHSNQAYLSLTTNNNVNPDTNPTDWYLIPGTGGGVAPTGPFNSIPAFNTGTGETPRTLGATSLAITSTDGLLVPGQTKSGTLLVNNTNCTLTDGSWNGNVCVVTNNNSQTSNGGVTSTLFQVTGAGRNTGPFPGAIYNQGWSHAQAHATTATFLSRGLHFMDGDNGNGMNCLAVGDCIYRYNYLNYIGGCCAFSDEAVKNFAVINKEIPGFYHGTVSTITDNPTPAVENGFTYPTGAHKVTILLNGATSGTNIVADGSILMGDPTVTGTTACHFNGTHTQWAGLPANDIGSIPVAGCTGAPIPAINAWATASTATDGAMLGDLPDSGSRTANIPGQQSFVITLGAGSGAFTAPDTANPNSWSNFVCVSGGYVENARITAYNASTHTVTANLRYPHGFNVGIMQGPGCAPYSAISIDDDLANSEQASSYIAFGSPDGGAHLIYAGQNYLIRTGDTPETTTSAFHLVPASEIVANNAANAFDGNPHFQKEDNGWNPAPGVAIWNPHPVNNPAEVFSAYDYTGSYNNTGYASGMFITGAGGPRVTGAYQVNHFVNGNGYGMYQHFGGWGTLPTRLSGGGIFGTLVSNDRTPWDNMMYAGDWMPGQTSVNVTNIAGHRSVLRKLSGTNYEYDFSSDGADSVRASFLSIPKTDPGGFSTGWHVGLCGNGNAGLCFGGTADPTTGVVSQDARVNAAGFTETLTTPASSSAACVAGQFTDDVNFHYVCTATNTWKRVALSTF